MKDKSSLLHERALITCVVMLFISIILKLFGVPWFNLNTDIPILQEIDNVVMNNIYISFCLSFILKFINGYLMFSIILSKYKTKITHIAIITFVTVIVKFYSKDIGFIFDSLVIILYPLSYEKGIRMISNISITIILSLLYQLASMFVKNLSVIFVNNFAVSLLMNIDYYIMLCITYLYLKKGDKDLCSMVHSGFSLLNQLCKKRSKNCLSKGEN